MTTQRPVPQNQVPTNFLLTQTQKQQKAPSGILPSGQENYFDSRQDPDNNLSLPINAFYPSPINQDGNFSGTGLLATYPPTGYPPQIRYLLGQLRETGILHFYDFSSLFSNATIVGLYQVSDFTIFNPYIHYYPNKQELDSINNQNKSNNYPVYIPYVSDYEFSEPYDPYFAVDTR